jgi:hypothetical protein
MKPEGLITYCGVYGGTCARWQGYARFRELAALMVEWVDSMGFRHWMPGTVAEFDYTNFRAALGFFAKDGSWLVCHRCCRGGDGNPDCEMRKCCQARGADLCFECDEFPCEKTRIDPAMLQRAERYKQLGRTAWLQEQVERAAAGFELHIGKCCTIETSEEVN